MNFSRRTSWHRRENRLSEAIEERRKNGQTIHDLTLSNPTECGFDYPEKEILAALSHPSLHYSPDPRGMRSAREAVADWYRDLGASTASVDPSYILLTSGSSEAYSFVFRLICNAGDSLLVPAPSYPLFEYLTQMNDVGVEPYNLSYDHGWSVDAGTMRKSISSSTRGIILIHPHNPTGAFLKKDEFEEIVSIAREHAIALIVDEVFASYGTGDSSGRVATTAGRNDCLIFTLNGISKMCGLPQLKLGWIVVSGPADIAGEAMERLEIIGDTFLSVNTPVQAGLRQLLQATGPVRKQILERCIMNRNLLKNRLGSNSVCTLLESEGGWNAVLRIPNTMPEEEWALDLLRREGVHVYPGYYFDFPAEGYLVLSLLVDPEEFQFSVDALLRYINEQIHPSPGS